VAITTISSREFNQNASAAKKAADKGPVFITDRGRTAYVLMDIREYRKIARHGQSLAESLAIADGTDVGEDFDSLISRSREKHQPVELD
jgi:prevent-host-death family protein